MEYGAGGSQSWQLIEKLRRILKLKGRWKNIDDDGAVFDLGQQKLVLTTDAFIVEPLFFPGGDIGKMAICGTINDLAVMGAKPIGLSLSLVIEEGFPLADLEKIIHSIDRVSQEIKIPVVTGDTKVIDKGKLDKIEITTAGVGLADQIIDNSGLKPGQLIIASGGLGEHGLAILAKRFNYQTKIKSDCQPIIREIQGVARYLTSIKDPTRGGLAANINEMADKSRVKIILEETRMPFKREVLALSSLLGIDPLILPSEGRFIAGVEKKNIQKVIKILRRFNKEAGLIGEVVKGRGVLLKTKVGSLKPIPMPLGKLIPRIC